MTLTDQILSVFRRSLHSGSLVGLLLIAVTAAALLVSNTGFRYAYEHFIHLPVQIGVGPVLLDKTLVHFVNDGLMVLFFLVVAIEIKQEFMGGELSERKKIVLPVGAAAAGMVVPALIYLGFNYGNAATTQGWAIPAATDIAFAIAVLSLVGKGIPPALRALILAIAILDDLGAILVIALYYTGDLDAVALMGAAGLTLILFIMNRAGVVKVTPYALIGVLLWIAFLKSGVHATIAGVLLAFALPLGDKGHHKGHKKEGSLGHRVRHGLEPMVNFFILPLFCFANAGVYLGGGGFFQDFDQVNMGIATGLFFGKQIGIFLTIYLLVRMGLGAMPTGTNWLQIYGMSILCGIGFTISLFIGNLAFPGDAYYATVRLGVFRGSILAAVVGYLVLLLAARRGLARSEAAPAASALP